MLTNKYLDGIPADSRAAKAHGFLSADALTPAVLDKIKNLNSLARERRQTLAQMAIAWVLHNPSVTSALIGASKVSQIEDVIGTLANLDFTSEELRLIDTICTVMKSSDM